MNSGFKLTVLVDNNTAIDHYLLAEPGLSFLLEHDGKRILFDAGYSDVFIRNAQKLGQDLVQLDRVVLSHGHMDHTWGLPSLIALRTEAAMAGRRVPETELVAHPHALRGKSLDNVPEIGSLLGSRSLGIHFSLRLSKEPMNLGERLLFLGEIPRRFEFEDSPPLGEQNMETHSRPDHILDDTALAFDTGRGLVLVCGCSHAGICNTVARAMELTGEKRILDIIGGLHLLDTPTERLEHTAKYLSNTGLLSLHACHCTDLAAKLALGRTLPLREVSSGLIISW